MAEYIDREALLKELKDRHDIIMNAPDIEDATKWREAMCYNETFEVLKEAPTADVVEVIRCKNCEYWRIIGNGKAGSCQNKRAGGGIRKAEDFCSFAKEKEK